MPRDTVYTLHGMSHVQNDNGNVNRNSGATLTLESHWKAKNFRQRTGKYSENVNTRFTPQCITQNINACTHVPRMTL